MFGYEDGVGINQMIETCQSMHVWLFKCRDIFTSAAYRNIYVRGLQTPLYLGN